MTVQFHPGLAHYDAVIVGARCAGSATALLLARAGLKVLVIDRQEYGSDANSTHALMRGGVLQLARWGVLDELLRTNAPVITTSTFHYGDDAITVPIKPDDHAPGLLAPRRTVLDRALVDAARRAGAEVVHNTVMREPLRDRAGRVTGASLRLADGSACDVHAGIVVGADGIGSAVARQVGARVRRRGSASSSTLYGYLPHAGFEGYHWFYRPHIAAGAIPTNDGQTCVFVGVPTDRFDLELRLDVDGGYIAILDTLAPELAETARSHGLSERLRGFRGIPGYIREAYGQGWALVGDAGFFRDPLTAHGITDALRDAEGLADAIIAGTAFDLRRYEDERDAIAHPLLDATDAVIAFDLTLEQLKGHHKALSAAMKNEVELIRTRTISRAPAVEHAI